MAERTWTSYATAEAFRDALETRLGNEARELGIPVNRLRKKRCLPAKIHITVPAPFTGRRDGVVVHMRTGT